MLMQKTSIEKLVSFMSMYPEHGTNDLTKISIVRSLFLLIEQAKHDGHSYAGILDELIKCGFDQTTPNHFYGLLNRIRLERGLSKFSVKSEPNV